MKIASSDFTLVYSPSLKSILETEVLRIKISLALIMLTIFLAYLSSLIIFS